MDLERKELYTSFNEHIEKHFKDDLETMINGVENKIQSSVETRKRITRMYRNITIDKTDEKLESHNDILQAMNYKCNLHLPDMVENYDINVQETIRLIKEYAENIKNSTTDPPIEEKNVGNQQITHLNCTEYTDSLAVLNERLVQFNLDRHDLSHCKRNPVVEEKLGQLAEEVNLFMKMVKAQKALSEEKQSTKPSHGHNTFTYSEVFERLLAKTNEACYVLMKNK